MKALELLDLWAKVNRLADADDTQSIRGLLDEAGIRAGAHVGLDPEDFTAVMTAEWALGQWVDAIDAGFWGLNSVRNVSLHQYKRTIDDVNDLLARYKIG